MFLHVHVCNHLRAYYNFALDAVAVLFLHDRVDSPERYVCLWLGFGVVSCIDYTHSPSVVAICVVQRKTYDKLWLIIISSLLACLIPSYLFHQTFHLNLVLYCLGFRICQGLGKCHSQRALAMQQQSNVGERVIRRSMAIVVATVY